MAQVSLYVDDALLTGLRGEAREQGLSLSKYVSGILQKRTKPNAWPEGYFDLYGSIDDETFVEPEDEVLDPSLDDACDWFVG